MANKLIQLKDGNDNLYPLQPWESLTSSTNLDDVKRSTRAWCNNVGNKPSSNTYGWLEVIGEPNQGNTIQKYYAFGSGGVGSVYIRCYINSQWYAWKQFTLT